MKTKATPRKRQPEETRRHLLDVVGDLILEKGLAAVTLDAVADAAGVSKGGLLHHFPNKKALLEEFVEDGTNSFHESIQNIIASDPDETGRSTRAELRSIANTKDTRCTRMWIALLASSHENGDFHKRIREHFFRIMNDDAPGDDVNVMLAIVYLAADGLAVANLAGAFQDAPELREKIISTLEAITRNPCWKPGSVVSSEEK